MDQISNEMIPVEVDCPKRDGCTPVSPAPNLFEEGNNNINKNLLNQLDILRK